MAARKSTPSLTLAMLAARVHALAPVDLAESWDNVGLQAGDPAARVRRVMTCLEVTAPTLAEARKRRADAIVAHHPLIFRALKTLAEDEPARRLLAALTRARIGLVAAHTNLDCASWGTNEVLAEAIGLDPTGPLQPHEAEGAYKLAVFTPRGHELKIIDAIARGGGGNIGAYTHCAFRTPGTGTFLGGDGARPFIGRAGNFEEASEFRIEAVVPRSARAAVEREIRKVHPYEEPAYEFYLLAAEAKGAGLGCMANLPKPVSVKRFALDVKSRLRLGRVRISGPVNRSVRRVAICTGSGGALLSVVEARGAQALLTGEANYHQGVEAHARGIALIEIGHFESERIVAGPLAKRLAMDPIVKASGAEIFAASGDLQPFSYV